MTTAIDLARPCLTVPETATVADVLPQMERGEVCIVLDGHGKVQGILTEYDLVRLIYESGEFEEETVVAGHMPRFLGLKPAQLRKLQVTELMTPEPEAVDADAALEDVILVMFRNRRKVVAVLRDGQPAGVIHRMDVVKKVLA
jgi:signal-transduction protein with cAMP-binding, CBS, and nucleotidyltransferase domain